MMTYLASLSALVLTSGASGSVPTDHWRPSIQPKIIVAKANISRRLRGDWEPPELVVLTYTPAWKEALGHMLRVLKSKARTLLLMPEDEDLPSIHQWLFEKNLFSTSLDVMSTPIDSPWIRDYGPQETTDAMGRRIWLDTDYEPRAQDDVVPKTLAERFGVTRERIRLNLDGGALASNGQGLCVSTTEIFQDSGLIHADEGGVEGLLLQLGCQVLALVPALAREETHHTDMFMQFLSANRVALAKYDPKWAPEDAERMTEAAHILKRAASVLGLLLEIIRVPHPPPEGERYYSYLNSLRLKSVLLVPHYEGVHPEEEFLAYAALKRALPRDRLIPIPADEMLDLQGAVHCVTLGLNPPRTQYTWLLPNQGDFFRPRDLGFGQRIWK